MKEFCYPQLTLRASSTSSFLIFISLASVSFHLFFEQWPVAEWWRTRLSAALYRLVSLATTATTWPATGCWRHLRVNGCTCTSRRWPSQKMMTGSSQSTHSELSYYTLISQLMFKETVGEAQSVSSQCRHTPNVALLFRALSATARAWDDRNSCECVSESGWKFRRSDTCSPLK